MEEEVGRDGGRVGRDGEKERAIERGGVKEREGMGREGGVWKKGKRLAKNMRYVNYI